MVVRNKNISTYQDDYLFVKIAKKKEKLLADQKEAKIINLGIGDTTEPLSDLIVESFIYKAKKLGTKKGYFGYGHPFGNISLRKGIAKKIYHDRISVDDLFISDGAKCDIGRLQLLFGHDSTVAIQNPSYPVYVATNIMMGKKDKITYMPCSPDNAFLPNLENVPHSNLIYICNPNNPTGTALNYKQLEQLVNIAHKKKSIIIYDSAYAEYIRQKDFPRSIYEVDGAKQVAIEIGTFSKLAGFTGVRLGWTVIPKELCFADGTPIQKDWMKIITTFFNGASNLAQAGGIAALSDEGLTLSRKLCDFYLENAFILREALELKGYTYFGGKNAPYIWLDIKKEKSWDFFDKLLTEAHIVTTPGAGFGSAGEGFLRLSTFGTRQNIKEAAKRLKSIL